MQPYLESLLDHIDGAPPWTPTNRGHGITSRPLKRDPETSPRDFMELRTDQGPIIIKQVIFNVHMYIFHANLYNPSSFVFHVESIPFILPKPRTNKCISYRPHAIFISQPSLMSHVKSIPNSSF